MRFVSLHVEHFKAIAAADVSFAPGLNVLYGPNDLGKSTLGLAVRAALLLQSTSSAAEAFVSWRDPQRPLVRLTFLDDTARTWRVEKRFGLNEATLSSSKDGRDFTVEAHERQVDEQLRRLLGWGVASPGGKGGPRGMPESFLANALLAAQTDVEGILRASLDADGDPAGRLRLTKALSALAQDPVVRAVLDRAEKEKEAFFTATGRRRGGAGSRLARASEQVKALEAELAARRQALDRSTTAELEVARLHEAWVDAQQRLELAQAALDQARAGQQRAAEKLAAQAAVQREEEALARADAALARLEALDAQLGDSARAVAEAEATASQTRDRLEAARAAVKAAEDLHRQATSAEGEAARAVERAQLTEAQARRSVERAELATALEQARAAAAARDLVRTLDAEAQRLSGALGAARQAHQTQHAEHALITAVIHFGHWRTASDAARQAQGWKGEAQRFRADALKRTSESLGLLAQAKAVEDEVAARRGELPDEGRRAALRALQRELELAEASLGGGVTVLVRPRSALLLRSTADQDSTEERKVSREAVIEADRRVQLGIGDLVDIEVVAGAPAKRREAELLRKKWKAEVEPALERASARNFAELEEAAGALQQRLEQAQGLRARAAQLTADGEALQQRAKALEERAATAPSPEQLAARKAQVGELPLDVLEAHFEAMGTEWEAQTLPVQRQLSEALAQAAGAVARLEGELQVTQARLADAKAKVGPGGEVGPLQQRLAEVDAALARLRGQLGTLEETGGAAAKVASERLALARQGLEAAEAEVARAQEALTAARATQGLRKGERAGLAAQAPAREPLRARLEAARARLDALASVEVLDGGGLAQRERAVVAARAEVEQASRDHHTAAGALSQVGGPQAREDVRGLEEAVAVARAREHHLEVDGEAWRLLTEAIREAAKEDSASLGAALAVPVGRQFAALTGGRYPAVRLGPALEVEGLEVPGVQASPRGVLESLSVGTRDHLATLLRLAIAVQLGSAVVLDDQLVHSDEGRLGWFREALREAASKTQVVVLTCRPQDYQGSGVTLVDLAQVVRRSEER